MSLQKFNPFDRRTEEQILGLVRKPAFKSDGVRFVSYDNKERKPHHEHPPEVIHDREHFGREGLLRRRI